MDDNNNTLIDLEPKATATDKTSEYRVLARKYRPNNFGDLIGQSMLVNTLEQAFVTGRISHAFMLTGVRGVGKTTTARLLARALNFQSFDGDKANNGPNIDLTTDGVHCANIRKGTHPDVLELDAASNTGVSDMRDLLENARYAPTSARFRVYVIDEVHMLSTHSFNALLKTLEEPPAHVKFIFATTEIQKIPVTILSRCQRFDLRRLSLTDLTAHLTRISKLEGGVIAPDGIGMLANAAEGSVRDGLSLLDQALLQADENGQISTDSIQDMLGLIDHSESIAMLANTLNGDTKSALEILDSLIGKGGVAERLINTVLSVLAEISSYKITGQFSDSYIPSELEALAKLQDGPQVARLWKLALDGYIDLKRAPDPHVAARMVLIRLGHAAKLPSPEAILASVKNARPQTQQTATDTPAPQAQAASAAPIAQTIAGFSDIIGLIDDRANARLVIAAKKFLRIVSCDWGHITCGLSPNAPDQLISALKTALESKTEAAWHIKIVSHTETQTEEEATKLRKQESLKALSQDAVLRDLMDAFPDARIVGVQPVMH